MSGFPKRASALTPAMMTEVLAPKLQGATVEKLTIFESKSFGEGEVSTAGRASIGLEYSSRVSGLPNRMLVKLAREDTNFLQSLYANEIRVYAKLRPEIRIETPQVYGAVYDANSVSFLLLLEDVRTRGATFPNVKVRITLDQLKDLIASLAKLHAQYWDSPRFSTDLSWLETHLKGANTDFFNAYDGGRGLIIQEVEREQFKAEIVQRLRTTVGELHRNYRLLQEHQATLQQTLLHGDCHLGNTYQLPDGHGGFVDWQLTVRGYFMHDLSYLITTSLCIDWRRKHERELIEYYLEALRENGVRTPPDFNTAWLEYRRAALWNFYIGWLTTPTTFYPFEIVLLNLMRVATAVEDHETLSLFPAMH